MKILVAVDSFKGSLSSIQIADTVEHAINDLDPSISVSKIAIADGGEGTCETLIEGFGGEEVIKIVKDPLFRDIHSSYGILNDGWAIIEMAKASGLTLLEQHERNPLYTTSFGVGELILDAINKGARNFIIGIGGSATNDGGIGMLNALGYQFLDKNGNPLKPIGLSLSKIVTIDDSQVSKDVSESTFLVACDVDNPLFGPNGAAYVYGKQKGASKEDIETLDNGLKNFSKIIKEKYKKDISNFPGSGAAGGIGGGFVAFLNATLKSGADIIFEKIGLESKLKDADLVITGEGRIDEQTLNNKAPLKVAKLSKKYNIPCIAIAGSISNKAYPIHEHGITAMFSIIHSVTTLEKSMELEQTRNNITRIIKEIFHLICNIKKL